MVWRHCVLVFPFAAPFLEINVAGDPIFFGLLHQHHFSTVHLLYLALTGIVLAVATHVEYKLRSSLEALFPSNVITPQVPLLHAELPNPDVCEVAEKLLHPNGVKQEVVFWIWVLKNAVAAIWFPQLLFGALGYFFK